MLNIAYIFKKETYSSLCHSHKTNSSWSPPAHKVCAALCVLQQEVRGHDVCTVQSCTQQLSDTLSGHTRRNEMDDSEWSSRLQSHDFEQSSAQSDLSNSNPLQSSFRKCSGRRQITFKVKPDVGKVSRCQLILPCHTHFNKYCIKKYLPPLYIQNSLWPETMNLSTYGLKITIYADTSNTNGKKTSVWGVQPTIGNLSKVCLPPQITHSLSNLLCMSSV